MSFSRTNLKTLQYWFWELLFSLKTKPNKTHKSQTKQKGISRIFRKHLKPTLNYVFFMWNLVIHYFLFSCTLGTDLQVPSSHMQSLLRKETSFAWFSVISGGSHCLLLVLCTMLVAFWVLFRHAWVDRWYLESSKSSNHQPSFPK